MNELNERQKSILAFALEDPNRAFPVSALPDLPVGRSTTARDLDGLVESGILRPEGHGRGRVYRLNPASPAYIEWDLSRPPEDRPVVHFARSFLAEYEANRSSFLTAEQLQRMAAVGDVDAHALDAEAYRRVMGRLLIDLTHASSNLENVKISWLDTKALLEMGERVDLSAMDQQIVLNHKDAIRHLIEHAADMDVTVRDVKELHAMLAAGLIADRSAVGQLRQRVVHFADSRYRPPEIPAVLRESFEQFCTTAAAIENPYEKAFFAMVGMPYLQPFEDANKRTSRLTMNIPLIKHQLPPFSFQDISKRDYMLGLLAVYERNNVTILADSFVRAYEKTAPRYTELVRHLHEGGILGTVAVPNDEEDPSASSHPAPH